MNYILMICLLCSLFILDACHEQAAQPDTEASKSTQAPHQINTSQGKPRAPVRIDYQISNNIQLGIPVVITLRITPQVDAQHITLRYRTEGSLDSGDPQPEFSFGPTPEGTTVQQDISVISQTEGRFRVIVSVTVASQSGRSGSRSMSIPVVVGNPPPASLKPQGTKSTDPQGKAIIVTPAQEEIIKH